MAAENFALRMRDICRTSIEFNSLQFQELLQYCNEQEKLLFVYIHEFNEEYTREIFNDVRLADILTKEFIC